MKKDYKLEIMEKAHRSCNSCQWCGKIQYKIKTAKGETFQYEDLDMKDQAPSLWICNNPSNIRHEYDPVLGEYKDSFINEYCQQNVGSNLCDWFPREKNLKELLDEGIIVE